MNRLLLTLLCVAAVKPQPSGWSAYTLNGKSVPTQGSSMTFPNRSTKIQCVGFMTESVSWNLVGHTLVATVTVNATGFYDCFGNGVPNFGVYVTTRSGYNLADANSNQTQYWWGPRYDLARGTYTIVIPIDPSLWTDSQGVPGSAEPQAFYAAMQNIRTVGFSFGAHYFDTGIGGNGTFTVNQFGYQ